MVSLLTEEILATPLEYRDFALRPACIPARAPAQGVVGAADILVIPTETEHKSLIAPLALEAPACIR
jgi:hypothetical protein